MQVHEVMTPGAQCAHPSATLQDAARTMRDLDVGPLPVCGDNDRLQGIVTDRDIVMRAIAKGRDPKTVRVQDVMSPHILYCFEDQGVDEAACLMKERQVRRLAVLNRDKRLVGIVSLGEDEAVARRRAEPADRRCPLRRPGTVAGLQGSEGHDEVRRGATA